MKIEMNNQYKIKPNFILIIKVIINFLNHWLARKNSLKNPQLAIFSFDHIGLKVNLDGKYESETLDLLDVFLRTNMKYCENKVALDIGANIGNHSIFFSKFFKKVYSFEPNPKTFQLLKFNSTFACSTENIVCFDYGLSSRSDQLKFRVNETNIGGSRIINTLQQNNEKTITIRVEKTDDIQILSDLDVALIKIDVEGHEGEVVRGAHNLIRKNKPLILFELSSTDVRNGTSDIVEELKKLDYKFFALKRKFPDGNNFAYRLMAYILRSMLGDKLSYLQIDQFERMHYDLVIAVPDSKLK